MLPRSVRAGHLVPLEEMPEMLAGGAVDTGPALCPMTDPDWLTFIPVEVRDLVASHPPVGLLNYLGEVGAGFVVPGATYGNRSTH